MASSPITSWQTEGGKCENWQILFYYAPQSPETVTAVMNLKVLAPWKKSYDKPRQCIKKQRHHFVDKGPYGQSYGFSSSHEQILGVRP